MATRAEVLLHPVRIRIAQAVSGRELTTKELAEEMSDVPTSSIYRHMSQLLDAGFIKVTDSRQVRGTFEKTYTLNTEQSVLGAEDMAALSPEEHVEYFTTWLGAVLERGTSFLRSTTGDPREKGFGYRFNPLWLTDRELAEVKAQLEEIYAKYRVSGGEPERRRQLLTTILIPDPEDPPARSNA
jgi:DNA-binding transcriptional ArsR family regulator